MTLLDNSEVLAQSFKNNEEISGIGDPYIIFENGRYYVTATCDGQGFFIYSSMDLMNWSNEGKIFSVSQTEGWVRSSLWQPQIIIGNDGNYYLYYCGNNDRGSLRIGVAVSDNILGPYKDAKNAPLVDFNVATIDPYFYMDDDGKMYLFFSRDCSENRVKGYNTSQIYGIEMKNYTEVADGASAHLLLTPEQNWELKNGEYRWNEGPDMRKLNGVYYLFYSGGYYGDSTYSMGYATSDSPLGPYVKCEDNPVIASTSECSGPGNNSFFMSPDGKEMYNCYHTHTNKIIGGGNRKVTIDRCGFREDGSFYMNGPTNTPQAPISGTTNLIKIDDFAEYSSFALVDGETLNSRNEDKYEFRIEKESEEHINITFNEEKNINVIYIYGSKSEEYTPALINIKFDDNVIEDVCLTAGSEEPLLLYFDSVNTKSVTIEVKDFGNASGIGISDISFYYYKTE